MSATLSSMTERRPRNEAASDPALPRLLRGIRADGYAMSLEEHVGVHGELPLEAGRRRRAESPLIERVARAGLQGRGGAAFPTAIKLRAVASARRRPIVVVNATEGEPASAKDRTICQMLPHLMLDGAELAAQAVDADEVLVGLCESDAASVETVAAAIEERAGYAPRAIRTSLSVVPQGYVSGQESALVNHLNGGRALPTFTPPMVFEHGVRRRPTLVNNAETLAQLALIARHGSQWFRALGSSSQPGSTLLTLSGPVAHAGVYEVQYGASLSSLIDAAGGATAGLRGLLLGGYAGAWVSGEFLRGVALSDEHLAAHGASLGAGVVALLSADACPVAETARVARWMSAQSARQCGPCLNGLDALATTVAEIASGAVEGNAGKRLAQLAALVRRRGACAHPDGAVRFVLSSLQAFSEDFADHARHGRCDACARSPELPLPAPAQAIGLGAEMRIA
jgi:NADH:ubiquinone oxidoreductase subunit F (NADH-binding)